MKRSITYILVLIASLGLWQACIDDDSVGAVRELSEINIEVPQDTFYVNFGEEMTIPVTATQTGEGNMTYEWSWVDVDNNGEVHGALQAISTEPELRYTFKKLGQFKVRLRVTNEDGSTFYFFELYVRTPFQKGLLVLSKDENNLGRTSFLRVKEEGDVATGTEKFSVHAFESVNPEIVLNDPQDITWKGKEYMMILSDGGKVIYQYDKQSFDYLSKMSVNEDFPEAKLKKICLTNPPDAFETSLGLDVNGGTWLVDYGLMLVYPNTELLSGKRFDKLYFKGSHGNVLFVNFDESYIGHTRERMWPPKCYESGNYFAGRKIVNLMADDGNKLHVITTDPRDEQSVTVTSFSDMNGGVFWLGFDGAFKNPSDISYHATQPLTLTRETEMLTNDTYRETYYTRGNELYRWIYSGVKLPDKPFLTLDGEITCMCSSPDEAYLYLGVWNPSAEEELKGSIYILELRTHKIIREYRGVADKPMKIMYKDQDY